MTKTKRYTPDRLLQQLTSISKVPPAEARRVFDELLTARIGDVVELGTTPEARYALRREADDEDIARWQAQIHERLIDEARGRRSARGSAVGQGVNLEHALISTTPRGIAFDIDGDLGDLLAMQTYLLVRRVGVDRLMECECGKLFVRSGKRKFCSGRCQKRVYMREFRNPKSED